MYGVEGSNRPWRRVDNSEVIISNFGTVIGRKVNFSNSGYGQFGLNGKRFYVHRTVYELFIGAIPSGYEINHINGDKSDNRVENLELLTRSQNLTHAYKIGLSKAYQRNGKKNPNYKNGAYLTMSNNDYHKAWERAKIRGLKWKEMSINERIELLKTERKYRCKST